MGTEVKSWLPDLPLSPLSQRMGRRKKLALLGASMLGDDPPPLDDPAWDVWGCNSLWNRHLDRERRLRADFWFEMHPIAAQTDQELQDMIDCPVPIYILTERDVPSIHTHWITYPLDTVREVFGTRDYFTVTFAYQIALAIIFGYQEIGLWGVELWQGSTRETRVEWPCLMWWLGIARGRGITITLPSYSKLLWHEHLYGYDYDADVKQSAIDDRYVAVRWWEEENKRNAVNEKNWRESPMSRMKR